LERQFNPITQSSLFLLAALVLPLVSHAADMSDFHISAYNYLVTPDSKTELPYIFADKFPGISKAPQTFLLSPTAQPSAITATVVGQENDDLAVFTKDKQSILALLDWPKGFDGPMMSVIAKLDAKNPEIPSCYRPINLINNEKYYYPSWHAFKVMLLSDEGYMIGARASGSDGDGESSGGWDMIAILKLSSSCELTLLHKEEDGWLSDYDETNCYGQHLDFRFLNSTSVEFIRTGHTCKYPKSKGRVTRKRLTLRP
jgi:hypothetical protein